MCDKTTEFINKAKVKYGDRFDYSKTVYKTNEEHSIFVCTKHGEFIQTPRQHLRCKEPCKECRLEQGKIEFLKEANIVHDGKYGYELDSYKNAKDKIEVICPVHGKFLQSKGHHLSGFGCSKCSNKYKPSKEEFIEKCREVHGDSYTYENVIYKNKDTKVEITCPEHGSFWQSPGSHINGGRGCPSCANYGFDSSSPGILYYLSIDGGIGYKIGITNRTVKDRLSARDYERVKVLKTWEYAIGKDAYNAEQFYLKMFKDCLIEGCKYLDSGNTEIFNRDVLNLEE